MKNNNPGRPVTFGVPAAPNKSIVKGKIKKIERIENLKHGRKIFLEFEVIESKDVEGMPNFTKERVGATIRSSTFEDITSFDPKKIVEGYAEFFGDEFGGIFRLSDLKEVE